MGFWYIFEEIIKKWLVQAPPPLLVVRPQKKNIFLKVILLSYSFTFLNATITFFKWPHYYLK